MAPAPDAAADLLARIDDGRVKVGVIGLGYVGLPLAVAVAERGYPVIAFDIDPAKIEALKAGRSYILHVPSQSVARLVTEEAFAPTGNFARLAECDVIVICVPTPLGRHREPDLSFVVRTTETVAAHLRAGQLIVLESTTYPGTTTGIVRPIVEARGFKSGLDVFLAYSPEREDPGNAEFSTASIPKVVGGDGEDALRLAAAFYAKIVATVVPVSSSETAEAVKLTENIFRAVNIALVNELKVVYDAMGIDIWEVVEAAKTKPFGFMPFYPGPGLGGHCIPIDPFYLSWKAREFDVTARFIELAGEVNTRMPYHVVDRLAEALDREHCRAMTGAKILVLGLAYKKNVDDTRESPSLKLIELLEARGSQADYHDPFVPVIPTTREHGHLAGRLSVPLEPVVVAGYDAVLIATDHDGVDYGALVRSARLVIDTRNACGRAGIADSKVIKA